MTSLCPKAPAGFLSKETGQTCQSVLRVFPSLVLVIMPHFAIFCESRLEGVQRYMGRFNVTANTIELFIGEDLSTRELGGWAFAHHLLHPEDLLVVVPAPLDMFTWDEEMNIYLPLYSSAEAVIAAYGQCFDRVVTNLLAHPIPSRIIITDLAGFDSITWTDSPGDAAMQDWLDLVVIGVRGEADQINGWVESPNVPLGFQVHVTRRTVDGLLQVHDYRSFWSAARRTR